MRTRHLAILLALVLGLLPCVGCSAPDAGSEGDAAQQTADAPADASAETDPLEGIDSDSRVVALSRSLGDLWLCAGGQLVGVTDDGLDLPEIGEDVQSIGSLTRPGLERIIALEPDLVLLSADLPSHQEMRQSLAQAHVPTLEVHIGSFDDYDAMMATFTGLTGRDDLYEQNVTSIRARIDEAIEHNAQDDRGTYVALRVSASGAEALKADNFACAIIDDMGLTNLADTVAALDEPTAESVAAAEPDWVFVIFQGEETAAQKAYEEAFVSDPAWQELEATKTGRVVSLPKRLFLYKPNARWAEAYMYVSQLLHGSLA